MKLDVDNSKPSLAVCIQASPLQELT